MTKTLEAVVRRRWLSPEEAVREVVAFERRFGEEHFKLACHCGLLLILTPELVNLVRVNFLEDIPWIAESNFLLSSLCRPLQEGIYEVEPCIREVLLVELENKFGWQRPFELAEFLWYYLDKQGSRKQIPELKQVQQWVAKAYLKPDSTIREFKAILDENLSRDNEVINLENQGAKIPHLIEILADPLEATNLWDEYQYLLNTSHVVTKLLVDESEELRESTQSELKERELVLISPVIEQFFQNFKPQEQVEQESTIFHNPSVSLAELLESGVHFGHATRRWNPKMDQYIYTARNGFHIIDLVQTAALLEDAYEYVRKSAENGKTFLFIGTKRQAAEIIKQEASRCGAYFVNQRWLGGMLTHWEVIKGRIERLKELEALEENGIIARRPKKEASVLRREMSKLQKYLGGIKNMRRIPDVVIIVDQRREYNAIQECQKLGIPIISLLDTNCDPDYADIPIPANDDAIRSVKLIVGKLADAIYEGRHGQLDTDEDYEEFEENLDEDDFEDDEEYDINDYQPTSL